MVVVIAWKKGRWASLGFLRCCASQPRDFFTSRTTCGQSQVKANKQNKTLVVQLPSFHALKTFHENVQRPGFPSCRSNLVWENRCLIFWSTWRKEGEHTVSVILCMIIPFLSLTSYKELKKNPFKSARSSTPWWVYCLNETKSRQARGK